MTEFVKMSWKPERLQELGLPACEYPAPKDLVVELTTNDGPIPLPYLLCWMQEYSSTVSEGWEDLEPAMTALAAAIAPDDDLETTTVRGDNWFLDIGPVDVDSSVIAIQRGSRVLALLGPTPDERLRVAVYAPLDARSLRRLFGLAQLPHPEHNIICLGYDTNWEYARGMASRVTAALYSKCAGDSYFCTWAFGLGRDHNKERDDEIWEQRSQEPMPATHVAFQLGTYYELGNFD